MKARQEELIAENTQLKKDVSNNDASVTLYFCYADKQDQHDSLPQDGGKQNAFQAGREGKTELHLANAA